MTNRELIKRLILNEVERMEPNVQSFEDDPINFILRKYPTLEKTLQMLMSSAYKDYITGIYIISPKPTTFKIVLHNDQEFTLTFLGKAYEAKVAGKKFYLQTIGERERCMNAISRLLALGNPISTKGAEGEEQATAEEGDSAGGSSSSGGGGSAPEAPAEENTPEETEAGQTES
jgi:uncharacterized membrane protein YgcG